jgi:WD40 repeat protein/serine/threonine protein kinase
MERAKALFHQAADLPPDEQRTLLDVACPDDPHLRAAVERLLADDARLRADAAAGFLNSPLVRSPPEPPPVADPSAPAGGPALPSRIGHYRILRLLGEGGMGTVYEAEQDSPRRSVALKVIRAGLVSAALLRRFAHEVQILGRLHHPGIAQIYEAALAEDGRPFFAMEFIAGLPLNEYVHRHQLDPAARLALTARVCDAVQHAHDQGVVHRDLKPGNILVDETGQPKVLDFGVARATDADVRTTSGRTQAGQLLGTLSYMSPEQVTGDPAAIDQRSDVYSLGVILFELLSGRLPYNLDNLPLPEVGQVIREREPSRLGSIHAVFRGDVETIVGKALAKDRARRYTCAGELAADIRRHLHNEPILARPPSALYQLRKFARRHTALVGGAAAVFTALLVGTVVSVLFALRAGQNERLANDKEREATYQTYRARLAAAIAALSNHDMAGAARQLKEAPEPLRDWEWRHLHSRLDDSLAVFPTPVEAFFLPSRGGQGLRLAIPADGGLRLLDEQGQTERGLPLDLPRGSVHNVVETPDGLLVLEQAADGAARLRDETGKVRLSVNGPAGATASQMCLSPNRKWLAITWKSPAGFSTGVYDSSGKEQARLPDLHTGPIWALSFSPDGTRLASASDDGTARLWEVASGRPVGGPLRHPSRAKVLGAAFSPNGQRLATASADGTVCQWDSRTGAAVEPPYERHTGEVWAAAYSPDGQWIASGGTDHTVRLWGATTRQDALVLHGHTGKVARLAFSRDGRRLGSVSEDGTTRIWEADPKVRLPVLDGHSLYVYPVAFSPDGQWIASGSWDGTIQLWDALTGEPGAPLRLGNNVRTLAFSPDNAWLVTGCDDDARLQIWDVATARLCRAIPGPGPRLAAVAVRPDGADIAALAYEGQLSVTDVATGREVFRRKQEKKEMRGLAYSPDGRWLAASGEDPKTLWLWDAQTYQLAARFSGHADTIHAVAFSPDSHLLASAGDDRVVRVWDVSTRECRLELHGHTGAVFAAAFHPGGTRLATAGRDQAVWLWDLATGEAVARLAAHTNYVWSLAFSPDGKTLVSGSGDHTVRLWDTEPLRVRHQARRQAAALRPEAERLLEQLWRHKADAAAVVEALRADQALSEPLRQAALRAVLRRAQPPTDVPGKPHDLP